MRKNISKFKNFYLAFFPLLFIFSSSMCFATAMAVDIEQEQCEEYCLVFPGSFNPPHVGHFKNLEKAINIYTYEAVFFEKLYKYKVTAVRIIMQSVEGKEAGRHGVPYQLSKSIWERYFSLLAPSIDAKVILEDDVLDPHSYARSQNFLNSIKQENVRIIIGEDQRNLAESFRLRVKSKRRRTTDHNIEYLVSKREQAISSSKFILALLKSKDSAKEKKSVKNFFLQVLIPR